MCVPTESFLSLALLVGCLGETAVAQLLDVGALKFLRFVGGLTYIGNGEGLQPFTVFDHDNQPYWMFAPIDEVVDRVLSGLDIAVNKAALAPKVIGATHEVALEPFAKVIRDKTYRAVLDSTDLRNRFALRSRHMDRLAGIGPKEFRWSVDFEAFSDCVPDEVDTVLLIARCYLEVLGAEHARCSSVNSSGPIGYLVASEETSQHVPLSVLHNVTDVPDVGEQVLSASAKVSDLLSLRESRHWPLFRDWFHEKCVVDPAASARAYVDLLKETPAIDATRARTIRFLITTALGAIHPGLGFVAGFSDTFLAPKIHEPSAKFFIEQLEQLTVQQRSSA